MEAGMRMIRVWVEVRMLRMRCGAAALPPACVQPGDLQLNVRSATRHPALADTCMMAGSGIGCLLFRYVA
jgi:hypothetical protein